MNVYNRIIFTVIIVKYIFNCTKSNVALNAAVEIITVFLYLNKSNDNFIAYYIALR